MAISPAREGLALPEITFSYIQAVKPLNLFR